MQMKMPSNFSRRRFLKVAGTVAGTTALAPLVGACTDQSLPTPSPAAPTPGPTGTNISTTGTTALPPTVPPTAITVMPIGQPLDSYLAVAPATMRLGQTEKVSVTLFSGQNLATDNVYLRLLQNGQQVATVSSLVQGRADLSLDLPASLAEGNYTLQLQTAKFQAQSPVRVEQSLIVLLQTDKPIYKPGQIVHIRLITLDPALKPVQPTVIVEVTEAKGNKIFKKTVQTDAYGMATMDLPLSNEPNLGAWKITASLPGNTPKVKNQLDIQVDKYVLPKYQIDITLDKDWLLADEKASGTVKAEYSYGKPVQGELEIRASKYVGNWQEFAHITKPLDGQTTFELPAVQYVAGVPASGGQGNVRLDVTVREHATGYEEKNSRLLTVATAPLTLKVIPESVIFKPGLPLSLLVVGQTPDGKPTDTDATISVTYTKNDMSSNSEKQQVTIKQGLGSLKITPPANAISLVVEASNSTKGKQAYTTLVMQAASSPSNTFIAVQQVGQAALKVGDTARFKIIASQPAASFYYEVTARGTLVFSSYSNSPDLEFTLTPAMAPTARLLVYQILSNAEVAADYLPFAVTANYPHQIGASFDHTSLEPGQKVTVNVQTQGAAKVALTAVDRSVFILAENRLNLAQVFAELEKLYQKPQVELESASPIGVGGPVNGGIVKNGGAVAPINGGGMGQNSNKISTLSTQEIFGSAGMLILSNKSVPQGKDYPRPVPAMAAGAMPPAAAAMTSAAAATTVAAATTAAAGSAANKSADSGLAEVQHVRQFFPETWVWTDVQTDGAGKASQNLTVPDSITTWMLNAVAISPTAGLGVAEAQLQVLQPFFVQLDLVYSAIRGEQFPVKVALYNYTNQSEDFTVELDKGQWFDLLDQNSKTVTVGPGDVNGLSFNIKPTGLGVGQLKVTARSRTRADAIVKDLLVEAEGVQRETVETLVVSAGQSYEMDMSVPDGDGLIAGSARTYLALTGNYLAQTMAGLDSLLRMPYGCGEQNMLLFAPDVAVSQYLKETGQTKPEIMAKAESLMLTGYQRELTYRRNDGSFSAFGNSDQIGSLWLSAFVLKTLAQAKSFIFIDPNVLTSTAAWIGRQQKSDGSFEPVGFLHHQDLLGGLKGKTALTAFVAAALIEAGQTAMSGRAVTYLESSVGGSSQSVDNADAYGVAIAAYTLELARSPQTDAAYKRLMQLAKHDDNGIYWGDDSQPIAADTSSNQQSHAPQGNASASIETTGYALLALLAHGDKLNAGNAARWLVSKRNAYGGWNSTQDTVLGLQSLAKFAANSKSDVDAALALSNGKWQQQVRIGPDNADVVQQVETQTGGKLKVEVKGKGQAILQTVRRYNVPKAVEQTVSAFKIQVDYGTEQIAVNNQITVKAEIEFVPPTPIQAGMVVLDVALPSGFAPVEASLAALAQQSSKKIKRYDVAGRKVILYIEDMAPQEKLTFEFKAVALYPIKAQAVTSQAYSYYNPAWKGEHLGGALVVTG